MGHMTEMPDTECKPALCDAIYGATQTLYGIAPMTELLPYWTLVTAGAAIGSLAYYVSYFESLKARAPARLIGASNEDAPRSVKRAA